MSEEELQKYQGTQHWFEACIFREDGDRYWELWQRIEPIDAYSLSPCIWVDPDEVIKHDSHPPPWVLPEKHKIHDGFFGFKTVLRSEREDENEPIKEKSTYLIKHPSRDEHEPSYHEIEWRTTTSGDETMPQVGRLFLASLQGGDRIGFVKRETVSQVALLSLLILLTGDAVSQSTRGAVGQRPLFRSRLIFFILYSETLLRTDQSGGNPKAKVYMLI